MTENKQIFVRNLNYEKKPIRLEIHTAHHIADRYLEEIAEILMKKYNFTPSEIVNVIDSELIGGVKVIFDTKVIDGSIKGQIDDIQKQMVKKGLEN